MPKKPPFPSVSAKAAQAKFNFKVNNIISGEGLPVPEPDMEPVDYYKVSKLAKISEGEPGSTSTPWIGVTRAGGP